MIAGAHWDFIVRHGLVLRSSLFILQLGQRWKCTYAEKLHVLHKTPLFLEEFVLCLHPRKTHFSAQRWNEIKQRPTNLLKGWTEGSHPGDWCFASLPRGDPARRSSPGQGRGLMVSPRPAQCQPPVALGWAPGPAGEREQNRQLRHIRDTLAKAEEFGGPVLLVGYFSC